MTVFLEDLQRTIEGAQKATYSEIRYHSRSWNEVRLVKGELEEAKSTSSEGVGIRVLVNGAWGFTSTDNLNLRDLQSSLNDAIAIAEASSTAKNAKVVGLADAKFAKGKHAPPINDSLDNHSIEEKIRLVKQTEALTRSYSSTVKTALCSYREICDFKMISTSDGALAEIKDSKPEFRISAIASENGDLISASEMVGVTGGWADLFRKKSPEEMSRKAAETAKRLLAAKKPKGERSIVILDPGMVGLISHEAIGHTVEADFVLSGSVAKGKIGQKVASKLVTLVDSGPSQIAEGAAGTTLVDDEGIMAQKTIIIDEGVLTSYLHNRETAYIYGVKATGNARAFEYSSEPLIRMRNTYIQPGDYRFEEMVKEVGHGYLLKGPRSGQADANGEFMFGAQEAYLIEKGEVKHLLRGVTISGRAFDVLSTVDAVSRDFSYDLGSGYCGKGQLAKVDGGGPYLRCEAVIGGVQ